MNKYSFFPTYMSNIGDKKDTLKHINDLAMKAADFLKDKNGNLLKTVHLKGENLGFYWAPMSKTMILVPRKAEYYLLPLQKDENGRYYLFLPHFLTNGIIICVDPDEIEFLGFN